VGVEVNGDEEGCGEAGSGGGVGDGDDHPRWRGKREG
jgi:hypothetical protein